MVMAALKIGKKIGLTVASVFFLLMGNVCATADPLDSIQAYLENNAQVQEKVYVHTDNTCYYIGDTIWYKAYVLRADDLRPTDMSKILYVELLSPDGLVADRQRIIVSDNGHTNGQFVLRDSLYSGYYEIRAYTRWMLNFNVFERPYTRDDRHKFYSNKMAKDFFRDWDGLYSRVIPIYSKPQEKGDYDSKYMYSRPKQEIVRPKKDKLKVTFYPEGGQLVQGQKSRVAFEVMDQNGQAVDIEGTLSDGRKISTTYMGRGIFELMPTKKALMASFSWKGRDYGFTLPKALATGVTILYNPERRSVSFQASSLLESTPLAFVVLCRGKLCHFQKLSFPLYPIDLSTMPTGVNELMVIDEERNVLASRMVFVNNHDMEHNIQVGLSGNKKDYLPYEPIGVNVEGCKGVFSIAVRDTRTEDPTYDNGNMLTDMLLSSDVKGYVANPMYYFSKDDSLHRADLDLLMMVQGWRRYAPQPKMRYEPEKTLTIEGGVYKQLGLRFLELDDVAALNSRQSVTDEMNEETESLSGFSSGTTATESLENEDNAEGDDLALKESSQGDEVVFNDITQADLGVNHGGLRHEVLVEAEIDSYTGQSAGAVQRTKDGGRFVFELPPFYGEAVVFLKAYNIKDSVKKSMAHAMDDFRNERAYPDYYVKQDLFYPMFAHEYSYYQNHIPPVDYTSYVEEDTTAYLSRLDGDHTLATVDVRARRRGRRAIDYTKPAYVVDAYDLYNEATDRGLNWGIVNMGNFPPTACFTVYGNMRRYQDYNVRAKIDDYTFFHNYQPMQESIKNRSDAAIYKDLSLNRIQNFRFYTDYEPRNIDSLRSESINRDDITLVYETIPDDGKRPTYRDRRYIFRGFSFPETFYSPDYSAIKPEEPTDYRRTLYWNPNAMPDENGHFSVTLYNNSRETRIQVSAVGVTHDGKFYVSK